MRLITLLALLTVIQAELVAGELEKKEIMERCRAQMGQYGASMVKACVDQDMEAFAALSNYGPEHQAVVDRCMGQMRQYGFSMVKACADQDIEAEEALKGY